MIVTYSDILNFVPVKLSGVVQDAASGKPVAGVHVFIVKGEEEAFSNERGEFVLSTWQKFPVNCTFAHTQYTTGVITVSDAQQKLLILIKQK